MQDEKKSAWIWGGLVPSHASRVFEIEPGNRARHQVIAPLVWSVVWSHDLVVCMVTRSSGVVTRSSGVVTRSSGVVTRPSGVVTRPSGVHGHMT